MEVAWEDRGRIPYQAYEKDFSNSFEWELLSYLQKIWWNRVFDANNNIFVKKGEQS